MKLIKFEALLIITIIGVITACNQPQSKDALIAFSVDQTSCITHFGGTFN